MRSEISSISYSAHCHCIVHQADVLCLCPPNPPFLMNLMFSVHLSLMNIDAVRKYFCSHLICQEQCPTGTRYPTRTRNFFQYPIRTRFVFKIIGYFGYRVFQNNMFLTWKTAPRSTRYWPISSYIIFIWLNWTSQYFIVLWANFMGTLLHYYITHVFPWVLHLLLWKVISGTKLKQDYQRWRNSTEVYGNNLFTRCQKKMWSTKLKSKI